MLFKIFRKHYKYVLVLSVFFIYWKNVNMEKYFASSNDSKNRGRVHLPGLLYDAENTD